jgi:hypothetical protein
MYARGRAARVDQVTASMMSAGTRSSDQGAVWDDIGIMARYCNAESPTGAMSAIYESSALVLEEYTRAFAWQPNQRGTAFSLADNRSGVDLFDHPETMRHFFPNLVRSYALDLLPGKTDPTPDSDPCSRLLERIAAAQEITEPAVGLGKDIRLTEPGIAGAALWAEERYIHLCAFTSSPKAAAPAGLRTRIARPSRRVRS